LAGICVLSFSNVTISISNANRGKQFYFKNSKGMTTSYRNILKLFLKEPDPLYKGLTRDRFETASGISEQVPPFPEQLPKKVPDFRTYVKASGLQIPMSVTCK
jgi:hypothetical protein